MQSLYTPLLEFEIVLSKIFCFLKRSIFTDLLVYGGTVCCAFNTVVQI